MLHQNRIRAAKVPLVIRCAYTTPAKRAPAPAFVKRAFAPKSTASVTSKVTTTEKKVNTYLGGKSIYTATKAVPKFISRSKPEPSPSATAFTPNTPNSDASVPPMDSRLVNPSKAAIPPAKPTATTGASPASAKNAFEEDKSFQVVDSANPGWPENVTFEDGYDGGENWASSFKGLGTEPFPKETADVLWEALASEDIEVKPDGLLFLPEIKYRRILNRAFGPGGWGLAPRSSTIITAKMVSREYGLICHGRLVGIARGEQDYFDPNGIPTAMEGCKSNALMRCCKDLGIASELWDPVFIRRFKEKYCDQKFFEKKKRFVWKRKDREWEYPYK